LIAPDNDEVGIAFGMSGEYFCDALPNSRCPTDEDGDWGGEKAALYGMNLSAVIPIIVKSKKGPSHQSGQTSDYCRLRKSWHS
jgi:hypothetical protein